MPTIPIITHRADLEYRVGSSDKVYHIWIENVGANHAVKFEYGRRGSTLNKGTKINTHSAKALAVYRTILGEKLSKGYVEVVKAMPSSSKAGVAFSPVYISNRPDGVPMPSTVPAKPKVLDSPMLLNVANHLEIEDFIKDKNWCLQEKFDGVRMMLRKKGDKITACNKKGNEIEPPDNFAACCKESFDEFDFIIDGEACGDKFFAFDLIQLEGHNQVKLPLEERLQNLGMLMRSSKKQSIIVGATTAYTSAEKRSLYNDTKRTSKEGVVAKDLTKPYTAGRPASGGPALKLKFTATVNCVVTEQTKGKRSIQLGVHDVDKIRIMGNCTVPINQEIPAKGTIVEVRYLYAYREGSLYQPVLVRARPDENAADSYDSLKFKTE